MKSALMPEALVEKLKNVHVLGIRSKTQLTAEVFQKLPSSSRWVAFALARVKSISIPRKRTESRLQRTVREYPQRRRDGDFPIVALARRIAQRNVEMHQGVWTKKSDGCYEVRGKTLGIIGYGNIGSQVSTLAESLGLRVAFYDVLSNCLWERKTIPRDRRGIA